MVPGLGGGLALHGSRYTDDRGCKLYRELEELWKVCCASQTAMSDSTHRIAFVTDERMKLHSGPAAHPEGPDRLTRIFSQLEESNLLEKCLTLEPRLPERQELEMVHDSEYIDLVHGMETLPQEVDESGKPEEEPFCDTATDHSDSSEDVSGTENETVRAIRSAFGKQMATDTYFNHYTPLCADVAVGCALTAVDAVFDKRADNAFVLCRPPGHHADSHHAQGFCFYNNVAVAARYAQQKHGAEKVAIIDWDVHHGNGTQAIFEEDPSVLFISMHRYGNGFYPMTGDADEVGTGSAEGKTVNIPWRTTRVGDTPYTTAFERVVIPIVCEFDPDVILVSAGFDAAEGDPLGRMSVSEYGFARMTEMLMTHPDLQDAVQGRLILMLEGGYNRSAIAYSATACVRMLVTKTYAEDESASADFGNMSAACWDTIKDVARIQRKYWKCMEELAVSLNVDTKKEEDNQEKNASPKVAQETQNV